MWIRDFIASFSKKTNAIKWKVDPVEGVDFYWDSQILSNPDQYAIEDPFFGLQYAYLKGLHEQSKASKNSNGFTIPSSVVVDLGEDFTSIFEFPQVFSGKYIARIQNNTAKASFSVDLDLEMPDGSRVSRYTLYGPLLKVAENEAYSLHPADWRALKALYDHRMLAAEKSGEYENNWLVLQLQIAKKSGMNVDLAHFNNLEIVSPQSVGVSMEELPNGDILLTPSFGAGIHADDTKARLGQLSGNEEHCIFRVKNKFVLLDQKRLEAAKEILTTRRISKSQVASFLKSPTAYLNAALIDLDTGFSLRVHGAEKFNHRYFGDIEKSGVDWFAKERKVLESPEVLADLVQSEEQLAEVEQTLIDAKKTGADCIEFNSATVDVSNSEKVEEALFKVKRDLAERGTSEKTTDKAEKQVNEKAVVAIDSNDDVVDFSKDSRVTGLDMSQQQFSQDNLKRLPFPHQEEGIHWILAHLDFSFKAKESSGGLLADDMGLGKTYMTLVAIAEWYKRLGDKGDHKKPVLIVAPLSLIENWQSEVNVTFDKSPFSDIVVLQSGGDITRFKISGAGRETQQDFSQLERIEDDSQIRYSLKIGSLFGTERLDLPGRLVLTTYQTLRDYQFSLSRVDWSVVVFDEAQNLKNPNALATRAAKGLKADFKLLATGTPVENTLKDFWCLFDTAVPGLLGAWQSFRENYIAPIIAASPESVNDVRVSVGRQLRGCVGSYMLRRTKAEKLKGLPAKTIFSGDKNSPDDVFMPVLASVMKGEQLIHYDEIVDSVRRANVDDKRSIVLPSLRRLKVSSIHHLIENKSPFPKSSDQLLNQALMSSKIRSMIELLKEIKDKNEKVLIFAETKAVQAYLCALISNIFKISVEIINGETNAVPTAKDTATRKSIIDAFQSRPGFGAILMSPVAAGVGLTVVGANNVIHMERHWNPAKEAQATDRVYRIGQTKDVNVYLPMALHPSSTSFDLHLNSLLGNKVDLSDAVVANPSVEPENLASLF